MDHFHIESGHIYCIKEDVDTSYFDVKMLRCQLRLDNNFEVTSCATMSSGAVDTRTSLEREHGPDTRAKRALHLRGTRDQHVTCFDLARNLTTRISPLA